MEITEVCCRYIIYRNWWNLFYLCKNLISISFLQISILSKKLMYKDIYPLQKLAFHRSLTSAETAFLQIFNFCKKPDQNLIAWDTYSLQEPDFNLIDFYRYLRSAVSILVSTGIRSLQSVVSIQFLQIPNLYRNLISRDIQSLQESDFYGSPIYTDS